MAAETEVDLECLVLETLDGVRPLTLHYQPIVDLRMGVAAGYEVLARFSGPPDLTPDRWFSGADRFGLRERLETLATTLALRARTHLPSNCFLTVNLGPMFLVSDAFDQLLRANPFLGGLVFEITEQDSISDYVTAQRRVQRIRKCGGSVAIDDTGAGYASLQHVLELRPDFVKLDRTFVADCANDPAKSVLIEMLGGAAGRLNAWVIAEGVETRAELEELIRIGAPLAQGFLLGRPAPAMMPVDAGITAAIRGRSTLVRTADQLQRCLELCPALNSPAQAMLALESAPVGECRILLDKWSRPEALFEHHPLAGLREIPFPLRVNVSTPALEVLDRMLTRSPATRFDPVVVTDENGGCLGILRLDALMRELTARRSG